MCLFYADGNLWAFLEDLVDAGSDGLNPLDVLVGMSIGAVCEYYSYLFLTRGIEVSPFS